MRTDSAPVRSRGQLVIPARLRRRLGIRIGTLVSFHEERGRIVLQPITPEFIRSLRGSLKGGSSALKALLEDRAREHE